MRGQAMFSHPLKQPQRTNNLRLLPSHDPISSICSLALVKWSTLLPVLLLLMSIGSYMECVEVMFNHRIGDVYADVHHTIDHGERGAVPIPRKLICPQRSPRRCIQAKEKQIRPVLAQEDDAICDGQRRNKATAQ